MPDAVVDLLEGEFQTLWAFYPRKIARNAALRKYRATRSRGIAFEVLFNATCNYRSAVLNEETEQKFIKHGATFFGPDEPWRDYRKAVVKPDEGTFETHTVTPFEPPPVYE